MEEKQKLMAGPVDLLPTVVTFQSHIRNICATRIRSAIGSATPTGLQSIEARMLDAAVVGYAWKKNKK